MKKELEELLPFYALGALSEEEMAQVEAYVVANPKAEQRLNEMLETAVSLPLVADPIPPSAQVKQNLMARINADPRSSSSPTHQPVLSKPSSKMSLFDQIRQVLDSFRRGPAMPAFAALALFIAIASVAWALSLNGQVRQIDTQLTALTVQNETLQAEVAAVNNELGQLTVVNQQLQNSLNNQNQQLAIYSAPNAQTIAIGGTEVQPNAIGSLTIDPETETAVLTVANLEDQENFVYQLWFIQGDTPISAGVFDVDALGQGVLILETAVINFDAIGISIEPPGGSEQPTGDIVLLGTVSS